jgi:anaerobic ribonucleoside-triphosphate reductase activating protein
MNIADITHPDVNNGLGCRITVWVSGCVHHCKGCHNPETWDFKYGREFTDDDKKKIFEILEKPYIKGITFSGGDPLCSYTDVLSLVKEIK